MSKIINIVIILLCLIHSQEKYIMAAPQPQPNNQGGFWKQHIVTVVLAAASVVGSFTVSQYKIDDISNDTKNLHKYTRDLNKELATEQRRIDVLVVEVNQLKQQREQSDAVLKGVQEALNKNTVAVELLSSKLKVSKI